MLGADSCVGRFCDWPAIGFYGVGVLYKRCSLCSWPDGPRSTTRIWLVNHDEHRSGKKITPFTNIGGGNLILPAMIGVSDGGLTGELADSLCASSSYRFAVMKRSGDLGLEEADGYLLPVFVEQSGLVGYLDKSYSRTM
ncbi:Uncharacterized protein FWK35_00032639, partial [Aphis craccivora]